MAQQRGYTAGIFGVELEGTPAGVAYAVEGGDAFASVVSGPTGADGVVPKRIANVAYDDLALEVGTGMSSAFYDWIAGTLSRKHERKDGAISFLDYRGTEKERLSWHGGLVSEIGFPELDAASKDSARMTVKIAPEYTRHAKGSGAPLKLDASSKGKAWQARNFRLTIDGVDCLRVRKIGALPFVQATPSDAIGVERVREATPTLVVPNLVVTVDDPATDFVAWHEDFVINGNNDDAHEKQGKLEFLSEDLKDVLFTLTLRGLGIFRLSKVRAASGAAQVAAFEAQIYCEEASLSYPAPDRTPAPAPQPAPADTPATVLASAIAALVGPRMETSAGTPDAGAIAARLRATTNVGDAPAADGASPAANGRNVGTAWARDRATLAELETIAALRTTDWTAVALADGHSLIRALQDAGIVPAEHDGPVTLERDAFVSELVDGAGAVYDEVRPHLAQDSTVSEMVRPRE